MYKPESVKPGRCTGIPESLHTRMPVGPVGQVGD